MILQDVLFGFTSGCNYCLWQIEVEYKEYNLASQNFDSQELINHKSNLETKNSVDAVVDSLLMLSVRLLNINILKF